MSKVVAVLLEVFGSRCCSCGQKDWGWKMIDDAFWKRHKNCPPELNYP